MPTPDADTPTGLSAAQAAEQLAHDGPNELGVQQRRSVWDVAWEVVREPMFLLLLGAGGLYWAMGEPRDAMVLLGFVVIIMATTVLQERRTDNALEALRDLSSPRALVLRDGQAQRIAGRDVVCGDLLVLAEGDRIAADALVLQAHELATDESMLTGESEAVPKAGPPERVFAGTLVVQGQGLARVVATGRRTELGRIGASLQTIALQASPLREEMAALTQRLVLLGVGLSLLLALLFWALLGGVLEAALAGITLAMGVLPQELPVVMIVFLALAARRLASGHILTRRLNAIETLGQTTVLCVDKTGTLTQNRMAVAALALPGQDALVLPAQAAGLPAQYRELLEYCVLASEIEPHDPMEKAFHQTAAQHLAPAAPPPQGRWTLAREYELSPALLAMSHLWRADDGAHDVVASKGAPEAVADLCHLPAHALAAVAAQSEALAARGLRVLGVAKARHPVQQAWPEIQHDFDFEWLGLVGLADPLRPEVPQAIAQCHQAGIRVVMITGDHPRTALAIAAQAGIETNGVLTGEDLAGMEAAKLHRQVQGVHVFARVRPHQKLALVEALKACGEVVAMTGDGVNDAPALKAAHIGVAMGQRGTDVAREAAALVLLDDDFSSIVRGIHGGRRTFANLRQAMVYIMAVHVPIVGLSLLPVLLGLPLILAPLHIAFLELVIDPTGTLVFEAEVGGPALMRQPPRRAREPLLSRRHVLLSVLQGSCITAGVMALYAGTLAQGWAPAAAATAAFVCLVVANGLLILPSRFDHWRQPWLRGLPGISQVVLGGTLAALALVSAWGPLAQAFGFAVLRPGQWLVAALSGASLLLLFGVNKRLLARTDTA